MELGMKLPVPFNNKITIAGTIVGLGLGTYIAIKSKKSYALNIISLGVGGLLLGATANQVVRMVKKDKS